jgi:uncharacterized protein YndB with AHSA1/START domain
MRRPLLALALLVPFATGCEISSGFYDPRGSDVALRTTGSWQINGEDASTALCNAVGIANVELVFLDVSPSRADSYERDELLEYRYRDFSFPCDQGSFDSGTGVLAYGTYVARWSGVTADSDEKFASSAFVIEADRDTVTIPAPNFTDSNGTFVGLRFDVDWDLDPNDEFEGGSCNDADEVTSVTYRLSDITADPAVVVDEATDVGCVNELIFEEPEFDFDPTHEYGLEISGGPSEDEPYWAAVCDGFTPSTDGSDTCEVADVRPRMRVVFEWDTTAGGTSVAGECADSAADLLKITFLLKDSSNATVQSFENVPCVNEHTFEAPDVEAGETYSLTVSGGATNNAETWISSCTGLAPALGEAAGFLCAVERP